MSRGGPVPGLFDGCGRHQWARIEALATEVAVPPGRVLLEEGVVGVRCYAINAGQAAVSRGGRQLAVVGAGSLVGQRSLLHATRGDATVTAITPMHLLAFGADELRGLIALEIPGVLHRVQHEDRPEDWDTNRESQ